MEQINHTIRIQTREPATLAMFERVAATVGGFQFQAPGASGPCDLLIIELGDEPEKDFHRLSAVQASAGAKEIFLTASTTDPAMLIRALRAGVKEFFPQPINQRDVEDALLNFKGHKAIAKAAPVKKGQIIDVLGVKGGVGTTTVAVNLAGSLASSGGGPSVALLDLNLLLGEVPLFLNVKPVFDWMEVARNISRLDNTYLMSILLKHASGVHVLPSPARLTEGQTSLPEVIETLITLMQQLFDFIVVDSGRSVDDMAKAVLKTADRLLLVATPGLPCIVNLDRLLNVFKTLGYPPEQHIEIVVNRFDQSAAISLDEAEQTLGKKISWHLPNDYRNASNAIKNGEPLSVVARGSKLTKGIGFMAATFTGKSGQRPKAKRAFFGLV